MEFKAYEVVMINVFIGVGIWSYLVGQYSIVCRCCSLWILDKCGRCRSSDRKPVCRFKIHGREEWRCAKIKVLDRLWAGATGDPVNTKKWRPM